MLISIRFGWMAESAASFEHSRERRHRRIVTEWLPDPAAPIVATNDRLEPQLSTTVFANRVSRVKSLIILAVLLLSQTTTATADTENASMSLTLHEQFISRLATTALPHSETRRYRGEVDLGVTQQPWSVDTRFTVQSLKATVTPTNIAVESRVRVQTTGTDYSAVARGVLQPRIENGKLILVASGLTLPLRVAPFGMDIDIGTIPADDFLPTELRTIEIDLAGLSVPVQLPNGRAIRVRITDARLEFRPPNLLVHTVLGL
ncbi:MAG: hypothetical protein DWQ08_05890 [Proteobacteria bacterium]|nr:MAG: hypothetical protein DWQ08_05890 [Pseudomonadota bacterium]